MRQMLPMTARIPGSILLMSRFSALLSVAMGLAACEDTGQDLTGLCASRKEDPDAWEIFAESAEYAFVGRVMSFTTTCEEDANARHPKVQFEIVETFVGPPVGESASLDWYDGSDGCPPALGLDEEWVIVTTAEGYNAECYPGGRLDDPNSQEFLIWLREYYGSG